MTGAVAWAQLLTELGPSRSLKGHARRHRNPWPIVQPDDFMFTLFDQRRDSGCGS